MSLSLQDIDVLNALRYNYNFKGNRSWVDNAIKVCESTRMDFIGVHKRDKIES